MKFPFTTLDHQKDAVAAVVRALKDQPQFSSKASLTPSPERLPFKSASPPIPPPQTFNCNLLLQNIQAVQQHNNLQPSQTLLTTSNSQNNPACQRRSTHRQSSATPPFRKTL